MFVCTYCRANWSLGPWRSRGPINLKHDHTRPHQFRISAGTLPHLVCFTPLKGLELISYASPRWTHTTYQKTHAKLYWKHFETIWPYYKVDFKWRTWKDSNVGMFLEHKVNQTRTISDLSPLSPASPFGPCSARYSRYTNKVNTTNQIQSHTHS